LHTSVTADTIVARVKSGRDDPSRAAETFLSLHGNARRNEVPMLKATYYVLTCALFVCLFVCLERPAYAYVDPGSSLLLIQGISSAVLGVIYFLRRRIKALLFRSKPDTAGSDGERG
jgi:hypothetical protein